MSVKVSELGNKLRVVTDTMTDVESVALGVWVKVGSRYENLKNNGISHLLEHMAFKGTKSRSAKQIAEAVEDIGGFINAYTSKEITAYHVRILKEHIDLGADIIADILLNSTFISEELEREKGVIIQEINQNQDSPDSVVYDNFMATAFKDQPLGYTILGPAENIRSATQKDLFDYVNNGYSGPRMVFSAAGNITHDQTLKLAEKYFSKFASHDTAKSLKASYTGGESRQEKDIEQVNLMIGFNGCDYYQKKNYHVYNILADILGGGMSSRLFQEIREKRGLVYSIYSFTSCYADSGIFGVSAGTGKDEVKELVPVVCEELKKISSENVSDEELKRAKAQSKSSILMSRESSAARCERNAKHILMFGRIITKEESIESYEAVTKEDLRRAAGEIFSSEPVLASLGPIGNVASYADFRKMLTI